MYDPESTTFAQRVTLCCLVDLAERGDTPADAADIKITATELLEGVDGQPVGSLSDADVVRALSELADTGLLDERRPEDRSPTGKGRPEYALDADHGKLRRELEGDDRIGSVLG